MSNENGEQFQDGIVIISGWVEYVYAEYCWTVIRNALKQEFQQQDGNQSHELAIIIFIKYNILLNNFANYKYFCYKKAILF